MLFAYEGDQGYYNATVALLNDTYAKKLEPGRRDSRRRQCPGIRDAVPEAGRTRSGRATALAARNCRCRIGVRASNLPVWISVIGQNGAWPVEVRRPESSRPPTWPESRYELKSGYRLQT